MLPVGASALTPPFSVPDDRCWTLGNDCLTSAPEFNHAQEISSLNNVNNKRDVHMSLVEPKWENLENTGRKRCGVGSVRRKRHGCGFGEL